MSPVFLQNKISPYMSVNIENLTLNPDELHFKPGKKPQALRIEWSESFSSPGANRGLYQLTFSDDADVDLDSVYIPDWDREVSREEYNTNPAALPYILKFTSKMLTWYEDTESYNERWMDANVIITKRQNHEEGCEVALEVRDNYTPGQSPGPSLPASDRAIFKYQ